MKRTLILLMGIILIGCGRGEVGTENINPGIESATAGESVTVENETGESKTDMADEGNAAYGNDINYDLTEMGADMIYATVYQMMVDPKPYLGKKFKVRGNYYSAYNESEGKYYHFCMIKDAAACCAQGLELLWQDEGMNMHENCPEEDEVITIEGIFETYKDDEGKNIYGRLKDVVTVPD